jgi:hypothetical protein
MEVLLHVTVLFTLVLALSMLIERFLEVFKALYDLVDSRWDFYKFWNRRTENLQHRLERKLRIFQYVKPSQAASVLDRFKEVVIGKDDGVSSPVPVLSGNMVRGFWVKIVSKFIAIGFGIGLAFWMKIDLLEIWSEAAKGSRWVIEIDSEAVRIVLTGIVMGLGSSPVHKIITAMEKRRKQPAQVQTIVEEV